MDRALITAWLALQDDLCPQCGRPSEVHKTDKPDDYQPAFYSCTATRALDDFQTAWAKGGAGLPKAARMQAADDKRRREQGFHPDRPRMWFTISKAEGPPI